MSDWRERFPQWVASHSFQKARDQILDFGRRFPWRDLRGLPIERVGHIKGNRDTLTHALIWGTKDVINLGRVNELGLWQEDGEWRTSTFEPPEVVHERLRDGLYELASLADEGRWEDVDERGKALFGTAGSLRIKPLYLWFPSALVPSVSFGHMERMLALLGRDAPEERMVARNRRLWAVMNEEPAFAALEGDALPPTHFFYLDPVCRDQVFGKAPLETFVTRPPAPPVPGGSMAERLLASLRREKNVVLTGPPGTGKTWLAQRVVESIESQAAPCSKESTNPQTWKDALALALYEIDAPTKVIDLLSHPLVRRMVEATGKSRRSAYNSASITLGELANDDASVARMKIRRAANLFGRDEDKRWFLLPEGKEYVEQSLLPSPSEPPPSRVEFVAFHPSFGYEEFVEGIRPVMDEEEGALRYEVRPGPFLRVALAARAAYEEQGEGAPDFLVVVDEINRADVARAFGDLLALLEPSKRLGEADELGATLPYSGRRLVLPPNLLLLATMNTSDRSVALMDLALRRRFAFQSLAPEPWRLGEVAGVDLSRLLATVNEGVAALLGPDLALGHAFFMGAADAEGLEEAWRARAMPQLLETFHGRAGELEALLGKPFFEAAPLPKRLADRFDEPPRRPRDLRGPELLAALRGVYAGLEEADAVGDSPSGTLVLP